ncbi:uncharacterized protein [Musca autumnalis]|uniref:uncharacterized protein n=1 Tax=Musca autumnalis TaxID=221902 RepID=UPI003CEA0B9E
MSDVWEYFIKHNDSAECTICKKRLRRNGGSTSGLIRHLSQVHKIKHSERTNSLEVKKDSSCNIERFLCKQTMSHIISKLAAVDGLSIRVITRSTFIRESFALKGMSLPRNEGDVKNHILKYYENVKETMKNEIKTEVAKNGRFALMLDEWTSKSQRRYLNICINGNSSFFNLGLVYISGRCTAMAIHQMISEKLMEYDLCLENHIVATISDGPNVMKRLVSESPADGFFCWNHAIHLAVIVVLYSKNEVVVSESETESTEDDEDYQYDINETFKHAVNHTRKIVNLFKRSPLKNACLQKYAIEELNKEVHLIVDVKTRWNSMVAKIQQFLKLKTPIKKTLKYFELAHLWEQANIPILEVLVNILNPIKEAVEALSRRDTNLLVADAVLSVLCDQLATIDHFISKELLESIQSRISSRRDHKLISLMKYLRDADSLDSSNVPKRELRAYAEQLYGRLFNTINLETEPRNENDLLEHGNDTSFGNKLKEAIANAKANPNKSKPNHKVFFRKEIALYEVSKSRTNKLENLYNALLSIKPTSVECERTFSIAGNFCTKIRNRMSSELLNALVILKSYFLKPS